MSAPAGTSAAGGVAGRAALTLRGGRRRGPILLGALLVVLGAVSFAVIALRVDPRIPVLAVAAPLPAGHVLTGGDLVVARIVADPAVSVVAAAQRSSVLGRVVTVPLLAHTLLTREQVGGVRAWPPAGQSVIAVPVKAGRSPAGLTPGVQVVVVALTGGQSRAPTGQPGADVGHAPATATVVAVRPADANGTSVVSLLLATADALRVVSASNEVALVLTGEGG